MRIRGIGRLQRLARRVADSFARPAIILLYHRVAGSASDPQLLCVSQQHFSEHLQILRKHAYPARLTRWNQTNGNAMRRPRRVILTFDDGYADNLHNAKPLLERYDVPATVFVATGYIGSTMGFWKDILAWIFLQPKTLPRTLRLNINGSVHEWDLGECADYTIAAFERFRTWDVSCETDPTMRQYLYRSFCRLLQTMPSDERSNVLKDLLSWAGGQSHDSSYNRTLTGDEVVQLAEGELVEIGSHTVSHPVLSSLSPFEQRKEIQRSKDLLEGMLGRPVTTFAYPYGGPDHYTAETVAAVREAGFELACSNIDGMVRRDADPYQLPRFLVRDWGGEEFERRFRDWLFQ